MKSDRAKCVEVPTCVRRLNLVHPSLAEMLHTVEWLSTMLPISGHIIHHGPMVLLFAK